MLAAQPRLSTDGVVLPGICASYVNVIKWQRSLSLLDRCVSFINIISVLFLTVILFYQ